MTRITEAELATILRRQDKPQNAPRTTQTATEADEQCVVIEWAHVMAVRLPGVDLLFHIPNGEVRTKAAGARLKAQGVRAGVPDLFLPVARGGHHGLWLELKRADRSNHPSPAQVAWIDRLRDEGYMVVVCYGAGQAMSAIETYMGMT